MHVPDSLVTLTEEGLIEEVVRPLMSGKEAQVFLVRAGGVLRVAKVYKEAHNRSFRQRSEYTEGRKVRNTRDQRAMQKRTRHGQQQDEAAWRSAEVDVIYRLRAAGVRVPEPYQFMDGVLIMELITDASGQPAPRLGDVALERAQAVEVFERLLSEVVRMLAAGVVHGDLSNFNVLFGVDGPVIIDFPQAVNASSNQNARKLLLRDVENLQNFLAGYAPDQPVLAYGPELWHLYERGELTPDTQLTGRFARSERKADTRKVLELIADAEHDHRRTNPGRGRKPERGRGPQSPVIEVRRTPLVMHAAGGGGQQSRSAMASSHSGPRSPAPQPQPRVHNTARSPAPPPQPRVHNTARSPAPPPPQPQPRVHNPARSPLPPQPQARVHNPARPPQPPARHASASSRPHVNQQPPSPSNSHADGAANKRRRRRRRRKGRAPEQTQAHAQSDVARHAAPLSKKPSHTAD